MTWNPELNTEAALLGTLMHLSLQDISHILQLLTNEDLFDPRFRSVLDAVRVAVGERVQPDPVTLMNVIKRENGMSHPKDIYTLIYEMYEYPPVLKNVWPYLEGVLVNALRRKYAELSCFEQLAQEIGITALSDRLGNFTSSIQELHTRLNQVQEIRTSPKENLNHEVRLQRMAAGG